MVGSKKIIAAGTAAAAAAAVVAGRKILSARGDAGEPDPNATVYHITPDGDEWAVQAENSERASSKHVSKRKALNAGRKLARNQKPSRLVVHRSDGTIQRQHAYGT
ncbi:MAG TPA: DUF2188 domain-containing protein [Longimicrobiales bacterium]|nr:DUF2188 domain-containing protein [Longimicrobiales bacterium]